MSLEDVLLKSIDPRGLELTLLPTEQCNCRCTYCYEDHESKFMDEDVISGVCQLISRRAPDLDRLLIRWFGGEPLLARKTVFRISEHIQKESEYHGFNYSSDMTTNAFQLTLPVLESLVSLGVSSYQITLDGDAQTHDETRKLASGRGTFSTIWNNILSAHKSDLDFHIMLRVHYAPERYESLVRLIDRINGSLGGDKRFTVLFKAIGKYGGDNDKDIYVFSREDEIRIEDALSEKLSEIEAVSPTTQDTPYVCYAAKPNAFVIRADGAVEKCTVSLGAIHNSVGELSNNGSLSLNKSKLDQWHRGLENLDKDMLSCPNSKIKQLPAAVSLQSLTISAASSRN